MPHFPNSFSLFEVNKTFRLAIADFSILGNADKIGGISLGAFMKNYATVPTLILCTS